MPGTGTALGMVNNRIYRPNRTCTSPPSTSLPVFKKLDNMMKSASIQDSARRKKLPSIEIDSVKPHSYKPIQPRPLLPLCEPPSYLMLYPPILPKEAQDRVARGGSFSNEYTLTTHLIPAAYPRTTPAITLPEDLTQPLPSDSTKEQRAERNKRLLDLVVTKKTSQMRGEIPPDLHEQRLLWNCINRYRRKRPAGKGRKSLTLLLFHANGFPKEVSIHLPHLYVCLGTILSQ